MGTSVEWSVSLDIAWTVLRARSAVPESSCQFAGHRVVSPGTAGVAGTLWQTLAQPVRLDAPISTGGSARPCPTKDVLVTPTAPPTIDSMHQDNCFDGGCRRLTASLYENCGRNSNSQGLVLSSLVSWSGHQDVGTVAEHELPDMSPLLAGHMSSSTISTSRAVHCSVPNRFCSAETMPDRQTGS